MRKLGILAATLCLAGCAALRPPASEHHPPAGSAASVPPGARRIDTAASELRILVYRAGPLAALGHNHVIVSRGLSGSVRVGRSPAESSFSLVVPAASWVVDDPEARRAEGADFPEDVPEEAKGATLRNMLSDALLDAAAHPMITIDSERIRQVDGVWRVRALVAVAGRESPIDVPFDLQITAAGITASGTVTLRQSELGLAPFSVMLGALRVRDEITVKFRLAVPP